MDRRSRSYCIICNYSAISDSDYTLLVMFPFSFIELLPKAPSPLYADLVGVDILVCAFTTSNYRFSTPFSLVAPISNAIDVS